MIKKNLIIIIPARSGSKEIKNKNLKKLNGKPLVSYSFEIAKKIKEKDKIIFCSTDSKNIKKISIEHNIDLPFLRPKKISKNASRDLDYVNHALTKFYKLGFKFKYGLILRPTSPLRHKNYLNNAYKLFKKNKHFDSMRAIIEAKKTPYKMWFKSNREIKPVLKSKIKEHYNAPRQILPKVFWQTGNFEFFRIKFKFSLKSISGKKICGFNINEKYSIDIDNLQDIKIAEKTLKLI